MPPKKIMQANAIIIDLNSEHVDELKKCLYTVLMKMTDEKSALSNDVYKIFLVGPEENDNILDYENIKVLTDWSTFNEDEITSSVLQEIDGYVEAKPSNVFEAVKLACHHLIYDVLLKNYTSKRIILFSDLIFESPQNVKELTRDIKSELRDHDIWLYVIGPKVVTPYLHSEEDVRVWSRSFQAVDESNSNVQINLNTVQEFIHEGLVADSEVGLHLLWSYVPVYKPPYPWYCDLTLGNLEMKVNVIKLVSHASGFKKPKESYDNPENLPEYIHPDTGDVVHDVIFGYKFKGKSFAFTAEKDQEEVEQNEENEDKCFEIKYFVDSSLISPLYIKKETLNAVIPDVRLSEEWETPLHVLAEAMHELKVAAVIKRVYSKGPQFRPKPHVMYTCPEHGPKCLLLAQIPTHNEIFVPEQKISSTDVKTMKDDLTSNVDNYLSSLVINRDDFCDDGKVLKCLSENLKQNPNTMNQYDYFIKALLHPDCGETSRIIQELEMHPILQKHAEKTSVDLENSLA